MNELKFYAVALTILVVCCLMLIGMLNRRINKLHDDIEWLYKDTLDERQKMYRRIDRSRLRT